MRFSSKTLVLATAWVALGGSASAQTLFQNTNTPCEFEPVLCATEDCSFPEAKSLACRHINLDETFSGADFNGDGFADCVALRPEASSDPEPNLSVLINRAGAAVACEPGPGDQFQPALDYDLGIIDGGMANVVAGDLNGGNADIGVAELFNSEFLQAFNPGAGFGPDGSVLAPTAVAYDLAGRFQTAIQNRIGERSTALFDCNGDGTLEAVIAVVDQSPDPSPIPSIRLNILRNDGTGLQPLAGAADSVSTNVSWNPDNGEFLNLATLTVGDFDNDGDLDVAVAVDVRSNVAPPVSQVVNLCFNNGSCGFTCDTPVTIDLADAHPNDDPWPSSIEAGDFNGDGNTDLVVALPGLTQPAPNPQGLQYYFGDGAGNFPDTQFVGYPGAGVLSLDLGVLTTGCYNNDNVRDVAVTSTDAETPLNNIGVFTSDGSGGLNPPIIMLVGGRFLEGIDTADFDQSGGDDIIALATVQFEPSPGPLRHAVVFMNGLETVSAIAGADQSADLNEPLVIEGASCAVTPEISEPFSDPASFEVSWELSPAAGASLSGADTLTPTFTADTAGVYTLTLSCRTRCTTVVTDVKTVVAGEVPIPTPTATPLPLLTQGGCLASLSPGSETPTAVVWVVFGLAIGFSGLWSRKWRKAKR